MSSSCAFRLLVNGQWHDLSGVQAGVPVAFARPSSEITSVAGDRHRQFGAKRMRSWDLDFGHSTATDVLPLAIAAAERAGETWLWDESAARENVLSDQFAGRANYATVDCGGLSLRSLTRGGTGGGDERVDVRISAQMSVRSPAHSPTPNTALRTIEVAPTVDGFIKANVPATPAGKTLVSASLRLFALGFFSGSLDVHHVGNGWTEPTESPIPVAAEDWTPRRDGPRIGYGTVTVGQNSWINLGSDMTILDGQTVSLNLRSAGFSAGIADRYWPTDFPIIRLIYRPASESIRWAGHVPAVPLWLSYWTAAPQNRVVGEYRLDGGAWQPIQTPPGGSGWRRIGPTNIGGTAGFMELRIFDSVDFYLAGVRLSTMNNSDYFTPANATARVAVDDPTLQLESVYENDYGRGARGVKIQEVGS